MQTYQDQVDNDKKDLKTLKQEIGKIEKLKQNYLNQKKQIQALNSMVDELKSQNDSLRSQFPKENNQSISRNQKQEKQKKYDKLTYKFHPNLNFQQSYEKSIQEYQHKILFEKQKGKLRFLSPQLKKSSHANHTLKSNKKILQNFDNKRQNKTVLNSLISQLRQQLLYKDKFTQKQRKAHIYTKKQLQKCKMELRQSNLTNSQKILILQKQNEQLKLQLGINIKHKFMLQQNLIKNMKKNDKTRKLKIYNESKIYKQLDKMDKIYQKIQHHIK